ncbi:competence type IV pilus minor pilin ComGF [Companilactobacillus sp. DQM5]|uniref:competence type IV pilus minor pilin ComGF n=1 Tax=Companilactobacillus sp. DQM5 TaxID=3463359 RepID=UPI004059B185
MKLKKDSKGFILYEMLIYLFICGICFSTIYNEIFFTKKVMTRESLEVINWHSSMMKLSNMINNSEIVELDNRKLVFKTSSDYKEPQKIYELGKYKKMLRISGSSSGHMPVLNDVNQVSFKCKDGFLCMKVVRTNGKIFEQIFKIKNKSISFTGFSNGFTVNDRLFVNKSKIIL